MAILCLGLKTYKKIKQIDLQFYSFFYCARDINVFSYNLLQK